MPYDTVLPAICPDHGKPRNRQACSACNAAYMRGYLRCRDRRQPEWALWRRAKKRAGRLGLDFDLPLPAVVIPARCPVLGSILVVGKGRLPNSPSLDRIDPSKGYVAGNCRVISDHANRIKGNLDVIKLKARAATGSPDLRSDYAKVVEYVEREELLAEVRHKAAAGGRAGAVWSEIATFLERRFSRGPAT